MMPAAPRTLQSLRTGGACLLGLQAVAVLACSGPTLLVSTMALLLQQERALHVRALHIGAPAAAPHPCSTLLLL